jgi:hypothetical protein
MAVAAKKVSKTVRRRCQGEKNGLQAGGHARYDAIVCISKYQY